MYRHADYPPHVVEDIVRIRRRIERAGVPGKQTDANLLVATWNIRTFGRLYEEWTPNSGSPKRNLHAMAVIAEIVRCFDVIAVQEVQRETEALRLLMDQFLGHHWEVLLSDVTAGDPGNNERLAYLYDSRRVQPSGLAGEIVIPPDALGNPMEQFARTPYMVGFRAGRERFALLTAHIKYGDEPEQRIPELEALARHAAIEIRDRARSPQAEEANVILLGDFNIDKRQDNPLFRAFTATGLTVPPVLWGLKTTYNTEPKYYDQIAWFMGDLELTPTGNAGTIDFAGAAFQDLTLFQMSFRISDHFPLWVEFSIDRSREEMAHSLGIDPFAPDPFDVVPE